ncbi:helix-turn-helix domain-containing protein [Chryseobacterium viscerum]|uniref:helix-turn-helix domain-containing protein n=1 Tax=Chryseobacterium viscerum TaxID=1037377 RepID=UPI0022229F3F|nr:helix-turn-helix domain-containing protein [Chryseobacterium viscerum]MCW1960604.1 helix-turn-helix domain-containing protein [Chryseobacterium viscerum]
MALDLKNIHIGSVIQSHVEQNEFEMTRICKFMRSSEKEIEVMYLQKDLPTDVLLRWSKLLQYDFFRVYSQYLILFAPQKSSVQTKEDKKSVLPQFRKNLYTQEIIDFILELIRTGKRTKKQVMEEYNIPKSTLYKWLEKY